MLCYIINQQVVISFVAIAISSMNPHNAVSVPSISLTRVLVPHFRFHTSPACNLSMVMCLFRLRLILFQSKSLIFAISFLGTSRFPWCAVILCICVGLPNAVQVALENAIAGSFGVRPKGAIEIPRATFQMTSLAT